MTTKCFYLGIIKHNEDKNYHVLLVGEEKEELIYKLNLMLKEREKEREGKRERENYIVKINIP